MPDDLRRAGKKKSKAFKHIKCVKNMVCHIVLFVKSSESMNMHLCLTEFVSYVPEKFSPSVRLLEESSFHTSLCKLQRFEASMQKLFYLRR